MTLEEFVAVPRVLVEVGRKREVLCRVCCVPGFERPAYGPHQLCVSCEKSFRGSSVASVDEWIVGGQPRQGGRPLRPPARPRPTLGACERCGRLASHPRPRSCQACRQRWRVAGKPDWDAWRRERPVAVAIDGRALILASVPERLRLEFLLGVQDALGGELKFNAWGELTRLASRLATMRVDSVLDVDECPIRTTMAGLLFRRIRWAVERALVDPEDELARDVWRLGLLRRDGGRQKLELAQITQPWLREIYRDWARESLGVRNVHYLRSTLCQIRRLRSATPTRSGWPTRAARRTC